MLILLIILIVILFGGGGYYAGGMTGGGLGAPSLVWVIGVILILYLLLGSGLSIR